jgi:putative transposase
MLNYCRAWYPGGTYFFTVNLLQRQGNDLLVRENGVWFAVGV